MSLIKSKHHPWQSNHHPHRRCWPYLPVRRAWLYTPVRQRVYVPCLLARQTFLLISNQLNQILIGQSQFLEYADGIIIVRISFRASSRVLTPLSPMNRKNKESFNRSRINTASSIVSLQRIRRSVSKIFILVGFFILSRNQAVDLQLRD